MSAAGHRAVVLRLYPPYSTIVGQRQVEIDVGPESAGGPLPAVAAADLFERFCLDYPGLRELFFPEGLRADFPGYTSVLRDGVALKAGDLIRPGDFLEVLTALSGG